jgi:asparagine synthase (glutamine-hydrolysing)
VCGIAGATGNQGEWIDRATRCIHHRGPDRSSIYRDAAVQLGHARLAVIDLSPEADQPMFSEDGSLAIIFNGEFYNFQDCRAELEAQGHTFRTHADTEVLLRLYEVYGDECLDRVRGMFAFAVWDKRRERLFLARDRMGEKPLYYTRLRDGHLLFASEIKSLLSHPDVSREIDPVALDEYLTYLYIPAPRTIFRDIAVLPPAHSLTWQDRQFSVKAYWSLPDVEPFHGDAADVEEAAYALLQKSVRQTLIADVPLGVFLSGGIDSASIVAIASQHTARLKTFTVVFDRDGARYDERVPARLVADHFGTDHRELRISGDTPSLLPTIVRHFDQPFGNPTALLTYQLSQAAREQVTVAVGGDGGDEVFAGYPRYRGILLAEHYARVPAGIRGVIDAASRALPESTSGRHTLRRAREFFGNSRESLQERYIGWVGYFDEPLKNDLYQAPLRSVARQNDARSFLRNLLEPVTAPFLDRALRCDLRSFLPYNVLEYGDKMSMAHGLEVRLPFLDADLVSLMARLPGSVKMPNGRAKFLLKGMMSTRLPAAIVKRKKMGFNPPMGVWIERDLKALIDDHLGERQVRARGYFNPAAIRDLYSSHVAGRRDFSLHLWALLVLEEWHRQYIDA